MTRANSMYLNFLLGTESNPFNDRERLFSVSLTPKVGIIAKPFNGNFYLESIRSFERGYASLALEWLKSLADTHRVIISGFIKPTGSKLLSKNQLRAWYIRHGFEVGKDFHFKYQGEPMEKIKIIVKEDGAVKIETMGFSGTSCQEATKQIEKALGKIVIDEPTAEMYETPISNTVFQTTK